MASSSSSGSAANSARLDLHGGDRDRAAAALSLSAAIEVFGEHGLRSLIDHATEALEALEARPSI